MGNKSLVFLFVFPLLICPYVRAEQPQPLEALLSEKTRLLVVSPHPDDETLGAGGLIQRVLHAGGAVKVVLMTSGDGYPEGIETEDHISHPTAQDYIKYGKRRQEEAWRVLATLGVKEADRILLGFPDGGLCFILRKYQLDKGPYYKSPFTLEDRPLPSNTILPDTEYNAEDLKREIRKVLTDFRPTLLATTHSRDQHPDHCSTFFFVWETLQELEKQDPTFRPQLLTFLIHFGQWPLGEGAGTGARLSPPQEFPETEWISSPLTPEEVKIKRKALLHYRSQMLVMGRYMLSFARTNELFLLDRSKERKEEKLRCCGQ